MGTEKRQRQKAGHQARVAAERAATSRYVRRRRLAVAALAVVGVIVVAGLLVVLSQDGDDTTTAVSTTSTASTTTTTIESAAGKPCVALAEELPEGAPEVPVPVGDPPAELVVEDLTVGEGDPVAMGDEITVHYIGVSCSTGTIFDSSWSRGEPITFGLQDGALIEGWLQGIPGMTSGGRRLLVVPPDLAYGSTGSGSIAPDETLVFVVDLDSRTPAADTTTTTIAATP